MRRLVLALVAIALCAPPAQASSLDLIAPIDGPIVRHFEPPPTPYTAGHRGIDYRAPVGTDVVASAPGVVSFAGQVGGQLFVTIDLDEHYKTTYSFLSAVLVREGAVVAQGDLIARSGSGAAGEEPNLHFGVRLDGEYIDPEPILLESMRRNLWRVVYLTA